MSRSFTLMYALFLLAILAGCRSGDAAAPGTPAPFLSETPLPPEPTLAAEVDRTFSAEAGDSLEEALREAQEIVDFPLLIPAQTPGLEWTGLRVQGSPSGPARGSGFLVRTEYEAVSTAQAQAEAARPTVSVFQTTRQSGAPEVSSDGEAIEVQESQGRLVRRERGVEVVWENYGVRYSVSGETGVPTQLPVELARSMRPLGADEGENAEAP